MSQSTQTKITTASGPSLAKNVADILQCSYVIPFYQRNYNWGNLEITQFIQDIYESYENDSRQNYYIGSLVVFTNPNEPERLEVIDGQQRLTTLHVLARLFPPKNAKMQGIKYDSRPEVEQFLERLENEKSLVKQTQEDRNLNNLNSFFNAIETIKNIKLDGEVDSILTFDRLESENGLDGFLHYFYSKVMLVEVQMPPDTDVASYFEIMNNRGRQLQEHEILKAQLMSRIINSKSRSIFGYIWDACSQMDRPIHKFFSTKERDSLFGDTYDGIRLSNLDVLSRVSRQSQSLSVLDILEPSSSNFNVAAVEEHEAEIDQEINYTAIIDFNNFLIHVLKRIYSNADIPLSSDKLLKIYKAIPKKELDKVDPMTFLRSLFFYRVVFDRYLVKSTFGNENELDSESIQELEGISHTRWMLTKPVMYWKNYAYRGKKYPSLNFKNTFEDPDIQERIVKLLSMLQVTYRQRKNKNYLQFILSLFDPDNPSSLSIEGDKFLDELENFTLEQFDKLNLNEVLVLPKDNEMDPLDFYSEGTNTPHFLFNFIDYLVWVDQAWNEETWDIDLDFDFTYRNSIEHHFPQAQTHMMKGNIESREFLLHCLGNLCLISRGSNSKLSDRSALDKATDTRYSGGQLTPKRMMMYNVTRAQKEWNAEQIQAHYKDIIDLLNRRKEILGYD